MLLNKVIHNNRRFLVRMSKLQAVKQQQANISYLVIDDEIAATSSSRKDFLDELGFINIEPKFVANCEDAIEVLQKNLEIKFCFLDCKLPRTKEESINYNPQDSSDYGFQLIEEIVKINHKIPIIVFSGYVDRTEFNEQVKQSSHTSNIIGYLKKDETPESFRKAFKLALEFCGIPLKNFERDISNFSLEEANLNYNYNELSVEKSQIVIQKTLNIKRLAKITVESILEIGQNLVEIKETLPRGEFSLWVESEFPWTMKTVNRYMNVFMKFNSTPIKELESIPLSVLYDLASKNVDNQVITETIDLAVSEGGITVAQAKEIKQKHYPPKVEKEPHKRKSLRELLTPQINNGKDKQKFKVNPPQPSPTLPSAKPKSGSVKSDQQILQVVPKRRLWKMDGHTIFNGEPNSEDFLNLLPPQSAMCLNFRPEPDFQFKYKNYDSWLSFHCKDLNLDTKKFLKIIDQAIDINTNESDSVIVLNIPHVNILSIIHDFYCEAYIVDPNYQKCEKLATKGIDGLDLI